MAGVIAMAKRAVIKGMPTVDPAAAHVRIAALRDGFRRAGMAHAKTPTVHPIDTFTAEQLTALAAEPMLAVEFVREPDKS